MRILLIALLTSSGAAAKCIPVETDHIGAGHLALAVPEFHSLKADTIFGYTPLPGAVRVITAAEMRRFASAHGMDLPSSADMCVEYPVRTLDAAEVARAMAEVVGPDARIEVVDFSRNGVPRGKLVFERSGLQLPYEPSADALLWRGHVEYGQQRRAPVWARARIAETRTEVIATTDLRPGTPIGASDVRVERRDARLSRRPALADPASAQGMLPRRAIPAGSALRAEWLQPAEVVRRGDHVPVVVVSSSAVLRLHARAESSAHAGQRVKLTNPENGKHFEAVVDRRGEALIEVSGASSR